METLRIRIQRRRQWYSLQKLLCSKTCLMKIIFWLHSWVTTCGLHQKVYIQWKKAFIFKISWLRTHCMMLMYYIFLGSGLEDKAMLLINTL